MSKLLILFSILVISSSALAQTGHPVQIDDGAGHISLIHAPGSGPLDFTLPSGGGMLLTTASASNAFWALGGNSSPSSNLLGTTTADPINFITGTGGPNTRMTIGATGNVSIVSANFSIGGIAYVWPNAQAASSNYVLTNDGTGNLSWTLGGANGPAGGDLTGTYPNPTIANSAVTSAKIADGTIVDADVSPTAAIAYSKLALTNSIQNADIVANAITTSKVANGTVTTSKMADSAITGLKLLTKAVTPNHMNMTGSSSGDVLTNVGGNAAWTAPASVPPSGPAGGSLAGTYPNPTIAAGAITNTEVAAGAAIAYSKLSLTNSIQNSDIVANAITTSKVANGTVTTSKMADSAITGLKLLTKAVTPNHMNMTGSSSGDVLTNVGGNAAWTAPASVPPSGAAGGSLAGTYPNPTIAAGAITNTEVAAAAGIVYSKLNLTNSIQNADIVANAITTSKVANGTVTTSKMADSAISGLKLLTKAVTPNHMNMTGSSSGDVLTNVGGNAAWTAPAGPSGAAGGDLSGTYPNPTVSKINGNTVPANAAGVLTNNGTGTLTWAPGGGGSPAGANTEVQFNNSGAFGSSSNFTFVSGTALTSTNTNLVLANNNNTATQLKFAEPSGSGANVTAFKAQAQSADITYTLPSAAPTAANQVLQAQSVSGNNATLAWGSISGGSIQFSRTGVIANAGNTSYNVQNGDDIVGVDMSAGTNFTVNLQAANTSGKIIIIKIEKYNNALLPVLTIQPNGTDKIDGNNNLAFGNAGGNRRLYSDGAGNWYAW
ncbi:MAG: hypothetical protein JSS75_10445 [Bacteroidetes bacterium]|nr:hypothetical protein [Bacteroidota bacterium]